MKLDRVAREAAGVVTYSEPDTQLYRFAAAILYVLEHGYAPEGKALVTKPTLLGLGVPRR